MKGRPQLAASSIMPSANQQKGDNRSRPVVATRPSSPILNFVPSSYSLSRLRGDREPRLIHEPPALFPASSSFRSAPAS
jgi:hypothetical protein